jgi:hypothetical protein
MARTARGFLSDRFTGLGRKYICDFQGICLTAEMVVENPSLSIHTPSYLSKPFCRWLLRQEDDSMASAGTLNAAVIAAMEEMGLAGWIPGYRPRGTVVRRERSRGRDSRDSRTSRAISSSNDDEIKLSRSSTQNAELAGMIGLGILATGTAVWAYQRYESPALSVIDALADAGDHTPSRPSSGWKRAGWLLGGLICGLGAAVATVAGLMGWFDRRSR